VIGGALLKLDRIASGLNSGINQFQGRIQRPVVVDPDLGDNINRMARSNLSGTNHQAIGIISIFM
jgi:hypothetical protein